MLEIINTINDTSRHEVRTIRKTCVPITVDGVTKYRITTENVGKMILQSHIVDRIPKEFIDGDSGGEIDVQLIVNMIKEELSGELLTEAKVRDVIRQYLLDNPMECDLDEQWLLDILNREFNMFEEKISDVINNVTNNVLNQWLIENNFTDEDGQTDDHMVFIANNITTHLYRIGNIVSWTCSGTFSPAVTPSTTNVVIPEGFRPVVNVTFFSGQAQGTNAYNVNIATNGVVTSNNSVSSPAFSATWVTNDQFRSSSESR